MAIPFRSYETLATLAGPLAGKVAIDAANYYGSRDGQTDFGDLTSSELVARHMPDSRLVKASNTLYYETLAAEGSRAYEDRLVLFVAGDDAEAKAVVSQPTDEVGFAPADTGSLWEGGRMQLPGSPVYKHPMTDGQARETLSGTTRGENRGG